MKLDGCNLEINKSAARPSGLEKIFWAIMLIVPLQLLFLSQDASAHSSSFHNSVNVRVTAFNPETNEYNFSCAVPNSTAASQISSEKFYAIDPVPSFHFNNRSFRSASNAVSWHLDPQNFDEMVHTNAMFHIYCEVQNFSAPPERQNLASEFHIDLRETHNQNDPNIYVLSSEGTRVTLKCDPPPGTVRYTLAWGLRNREGITSFPSLANQRIVNITAPEPTAGWDVTCDVFDKDKGKTFHWDMPIEFFENGPAYIPTIEGCVNNEPCTWAPNVNGVPLNGTLILNVTLNQTPVQASIFINEIFSGTTNSSGFLTVQNIIPGLHNLVIRKEGYAGVSTLIPIAAGKTLQRNYSITENTTSPVQDSCHSTVFSIPSRCNNGNIIFDDAGGCRTLLCNNGSSNLQVLACNKPGNSNPQNFEMYRQSQNGTVQLELCLGNTCIKDNGFAASQNFPVCIGNATQQMLNGSLRVSTIPNFADVYVDSALRGNSGLIGSITIDNLIPGNHQLLVRKTNYTDNLSQVNIVSGELKDVQAKLGQNSSNQNQSNQSTQQNLTQTIPVCFSTVKNITASCDGIIVKDTLNSPCRTLTCKNGQNNISVMACDKPDSSVPQYFEMYRQLATSDPPKLCIGELCMKSEGFLRSENYPICINRTINPTVNNTQPPAANNTNNSSNNQNITFLKCISNVQNATASCNGGTIASDIWNGGRQITCSFGGNSLSISAWNKPDTSVPQYFEMYKGAFAGSGIEICLENTCIKNGGYAKSQNYPICTGSSSTNNQTNTNSTTNNPPQSGTTYTNIQNIPSSCDGGSITSDIFNGGRQITCTGNGKSMSISGWDKPDSNAPQYFEMYKVSGDGLKICIANTCISDNGYAKSPNYPITFGGGGGSTWTANTSNSTNNPAPPQNVCYSDVKNIPATCNGGSIVSDNFNGGRSITCTSNGNSLGINAWDKPDSGTKQYFEIYKAAQVGSGIQICLANTCISNEGYVKSSNYPICTTSSSASPSSNGLSGPIWISQSGTTGASPSFFHLETQEASNPSVHSISDFEVWNSAMSERVWYANGKTGTLRYHLHAPDGIFENSLAGKTQLNYGTTYNARVRYKDTSGSYTGWSSWMSFTTLNQQGSDPTAPEWKTAIGFRTETFSTGFNFPVHVAAAPVGMYSSLPDNLEPFLYVTELYGQVKVVYKDGSQSTYAQDLLNFEPFSSITGGGQMGVVGLYVDDATGDLFVGMVYVENDQVKNKVVRFFSNDNGNSFTGSQIIINNLPSAPSHQVQQITKGPDGKLYIALGDALTPSYAQSDSILAGKIIRMNMDGTSVQVYAKGFRNPFGIDWRPGTAQLFGTDNAPDTLDRIVKINQGENYGWGMNDNNAMWKSKVMHYTDVSPVDVEFDPGNKGFPSDLTGKMYVAVAGPAYQQGVTKSKHILEFSLDANGNVIGNRTFVKYNGDGYGTPIGLDFGPDGLYFTDIYGNNGISGFGSEGRILRVVPGTPGTGGNSTGQFRANIFISPWYPKDKGSTVEYEFTCNAIDGSGNYRYDWDMGNGGKFFNDAWNKKLQTYPKTNQDYTVSCTAKDQVTGKSASASMVINPSTVIA